MPCYCGQAKKPKETIKWCDNQSPSLSFCQPWPVTVSFCFGLAWLKPSPTPLECCMFYVSLTKRRGFATIHALSKPRTVAKNVQEERGEATSTRNVGAGGIDGAGDTIASSEAVCQLRPSGESFLLPAFITVASPPTRQTRVLETALDRHTRTRTDRASCFCSSSTTPFSPDTCSDPRSHSRPPPLLGVHRFLQFFSGVVHYFRHIRTLVHLFRLTTTSRAIVNRRRPGCSLVDVGRRVLKTFNVYTLL